jgi:hypothetical protein
VVVYQQYITGTTGNLNLAANVFNGTAWLANGLNLDDKGLTTANGNTISTVPSVALDANGNASVAWVQSNGTNVNVCYARYTAGTTNTWSNVSSSAIENTTVAATAVQLAMDKNGNLWATWVQGSGTSYTLYARSCTAAGTWSTTTTTLGTATAAPTPRLSVSPAGNALVSWLTGGNLYARRYSAGAWQGTAAEAIETTTAASYSPQGRINDAGQALISYLQTDGTTTNVYTRLYSGGAWGASKLIENSTASVTTTVQPSVALDAAGNASVVWIQNDAGAIASVYTNRYNTDSTAYYTVKSTDSSWASLTQSVYGTSSANAIAALQTALGFTSSSAVPAAGAQLKVPASLTYSASHVEIGVTDALGHTTTYIHDDKNRLARIYANGAIGTRLTTAYH